MDSARPANVVVPPAALSGVLMAATVGSEFAFIFWLMAKGAGKTERSMVAAV